MNNVVALLAPRRLAMTNPNAPQHASTMMPHAPARIATDHRLARETEMVAVTPATPMAVGNAPPTESTGIAAQAIINGQVHLGTGSEADPGTGAPLRTTWTPFRKGAPVTGPKRTDKMEPSRSLNVVPR